MPFVRFADVIAELPHVDDPDAVKRVGTNRALSIALDPTEAAEVVLLADFLLRVLSRLGSKE